MGGIKKFGVGKKSRYSSQKIWSRKKSYKEKVGKSS